MIAEQIDCLRNIARCIDQAADSSTGSTIEGSSLSGLLTRVEIRHRRIGSAGNGRIRSCGSGPSPSQRAQSPCAMIERHAVVYFSNKLVGVRGGDREAKCSARPLRPHKQTNRRHPVRSATCHERPKRPAPGGNPPLTYIGRQSTPARPGIESLQSHQSRNPMQTAAEAFGQRITPDPSGSIGSKRRISYKRKFAVRKHRF